MLQRHYEEVGWKVCEVLFVVLRMVLAGEHNMLVLVVDNIVVDLVMVAADNYDLVVDMMVVVVLNLVEHK